MKNYKVEAWPWCADYCKKNQWNPHDSYFWDKAMLEYRRQHNIYEVGDKIIFDVVGNSVMEYADCLNMFLSQSLIRHATEAEIQAGKRL